MARHVILQLSVTWVPTFSAKPVHVRVKTTTTTILATVFKVRENIIDFFLF